jgi:UDP-glucose 4-epimerase
VKARPGDITRFAISPVRARIHLAWAPFTDLADGLAALLGGD